MKKIILLLFISQFSCAMKRPNDGENPLAKRPICPVQVMQTYSLFYLPTEILGLIFSAYAQIAVDYPDAMKVAHFLLKLRPKSIDLAAHCSTIIAAKFEKCPFFVAAQLGQGSTICWLNQQFQKREELRRACMIADRVLQRNKLITLSTFLSAGIHPNMLSWIKYVDRPDVVRLMIAHGAAVNAAALDGATALHYAAERGLNHSVQLLLQASADVNRGCIIEQADDEIMLDEGDTPLHRAVEHFFEDERNGPTQIILLLLRAGANPLLQNRQGRTVLHSAVSALPLDLIDQLLSSIPDPELVRFALQLEDHNGETPLEYALDSSRDDSYKIVELFNNKLGLKP